MRIYTKMKVTEIMLLSFYLHKTYIHDTVVILNITKNYCLFKQLKAVRVTV